MRGDIGATKAPDVLLAGLDALCPAVSIGEAGEDGCSHTLDIIGVDIQAMGTTCLLKTGTGTGDNGESCGNCLDNGDAETLVTGGIDKSLGKTIDNGEVCIRDTAQQVDAVVLGQFLRILGLSSH